MAVYMIVDVDVRDPAKYEVYKAGVSPLIQQHGGEYLVRGGELEVVEGDWLPKRLVLFRFPDRASVRAFYEDPEYQSLKGLRHSVAATNIVVVEGL